MYSSHGQGKSRILTALLGLAALIFVLAAAPAARAASGVKILPHKAFYDLALGKIRDDSKVTRASGRLEFEWADACDAWTVSQRSRIQVAYSDGRVIDFGWSHNSWEAKDGLRYRFFIRRIHAGASVEETRGEATLSAPGGAGTAKFTLPAEREMALPAGTLFPTGHSLALLAAAEADSLPLWRVVFDGSGEEGLYGVSAASSGRFQAGQPASLASPLIDDQISWRLQLAFFGMDESASEPQQEQNLRLFPNGIADELTFDYGEFALKGTLRALNALSAPDC